ncbi:MAG: hypothetical protein RLT05_19425 [Bauldia litoralis]
MNDELLLVGSVPLETPEEVFRVFGPALGASLPYLPDGEQGDRRFWIDGIAYRVLNGHPQLETLSRPAPDENGPDTWHPQGDHDQFKFRVLPGVDEVQFGEPGWRLGYARDALNSWFVFKTLKKEGVIPGHVRFQVCLPLTFSALGLFVPDEDDLLKIAPGMTRALRAEVENIAAHIPPDELAIQWDLAIENRRIEAKLVAGDPDGAWGEAKKVAAPMAEANAGLHDEVHVGLHSCYGTVNGWPSRQPESIRGTVLLLNAHAGEAGRPIDFVHFPTVAAADDAWFQPLEDLDVGDARIYVGAIHHLHGAAGLRGQIGTVKKYLPKFGLAAPCGFGRVPVRPGRQLTDEGDVVPPDFMRIILEDHKKAVDVLHEVSH